MVHLRPVILALLLALAAPTAAISPSAPSTQSIQSSLATSTADAQMYAPANTSAVLTLGEDAEETRAFATASTDLGTALATEKDGMNHKLTSQSFDEEFSGVDGRENQRDLLFRYATSIEDRIMELEQRETNARQGFQNGSLSARSYLRTLARVDAEAGRLKVELNQIKTYSNEVEFPLTDYLGRLEKRLLSLEGPVRDRTARVVSGDAPVIDVYVSAADNGIILATIDEGEYLREIYRADHRSLENEGQLGQSAVDEIMGQTYPWVADVAYGTEWRGSSSKGFHYYQSEHEHGSIVTYIDEGTETVFRSSQWKYLTPDAAGQNGFESTVPKGPGVTANESNLLLTVNRSYAGGPMYVSLQDNETGDFVEGSITVDGEPVGKTTTEGGLWTLSPAGSFNVSASSGLDIVTVETRATRPLSDTNSTEA